MIISLVRDCSDMAVSDKAGRPQHSANAAKQTKKVAMNLDDAILNSRYIEYNRPASEISCFIAIANCTGLLKVL